MSSGLKLQSFVFIIGFVKYKNGVDEETLKASSPRIEVVVKICERNNYVIIKKLKILNISGNLC